MKDFQVKPDGAKYQLMQTPFDIGDKRFVAFKQYFLQTIEGLDKPSFLAEFERYKSLHDQGKHGDALISWHNFKTALELKEQNYDAYSICFCLLLLAEGEDMNDTDTSKQLKKLESLRQEGINRGMIEQEVENFLNASPTQFALYLEVRKTIQLLSEETLKK